jgi:hypothetical protein
MCFHKVKILEDQAIAALKSSAVLQNALRNRHPDNDSLFDGTTIPFALDAVTSQHATVPLGLPALAAGKGSRRKQFGPIRVQSAARNLVPIPSPATPEHQGFEQVGSAKGPFQGV